MMAELIFNALDAVQDIENPEIYVSISRRGAFGTIAVSDNGCGVDSGFGGQLFQVGTTSKPEGVGLGLVFCRIAALYMGGHVAHRSLHQGGSEFTVTLPIYEAPPGSTPFA